MVVNAIKCIVLGDLYVGRFSFLVTCAATEYSIGYIPTVSDKYTIDVLLELSGQTATINVMEPLRGTGTEEHDRKKRMCYPNTDVFLICFSLSNRESYEHVRTKWHPEVKLHRPTAAIILVGTKLDKEYLIRDQLFTTEDGLQLAKEIGAVKYLECLSQTQGCVKEVFKEVARAWYKETAKKKKQCILL
ncbi:ras-related C3 botulinum toxin substrate 1-like [Hydractinia symbiolongicarpus]|uniref:ras-related C3 botulinum toxin substrate 1-like n=1 Tax=Hydractinia symbiolongicarpus TaxID=13093 RepID=UPI0025508B40|nr:ras-related C3 botulinum toxin substrate 1-like [Hydractinia symbiolongicarpus]XP_057311901.1 ras-related C3 botulinum toxin substrate 1-like [Hydractinia symbiolongicarpus]